jgi:hypothetical protein
MASKAMGEGERAMPPPDLPHHRIIGLLAQCLEKSRLCRYPISFTRKRRFNQNRSCGQLLCPSYFLHYFDFKPPLNITHDFHANLNVYMPEQKGEVQTILPTPSLPALLDRSGINAGPHRASPQP